MGGLSPADMVLELSDCEAFVRMYDSDNLGYITVDDFMAATSAQQYSTMKSQLSEDGSLNFS